MPKGNVFFVFLLFLSCSSNVQAMDMEEKENKSIGFSSVPARKNHNYILNTESIGFKRLKFHTDLLTNHTKKHLEMANLSPDKIVYDLGCGPGLVTIPLAQNAKHIYAVDSSDAQLKLAQEMVTNARLTNVTFIESDIRELTSPPQKGEVDVVYIRCVLAHVKNPEKIIEIAKGLLKPGGYILSIEPIISTFWGSAPALATISREWGECAVKLGKKLGNDYDIGKRSADLLKKGGFTVEESFLVKQEINVETMKELFGLEILDGPPNAVKAGALTQEQIEKWKRIVAEVDDNDTSSFYLPEYAFVVAKKEP